MPKSIPSQDESGELSGSTEYSTCGNSLLHMRDMLSDHLSESAVIFVDRQKLKYSPGLAGTINDRECDRFIASFHDPIRVLGQHH